VLGICYGLHFIVHHLGGKVRPPASASMGTPRSRLRMRQRYFLLDCRQTIQVWMSHGDEALELPAGFHRTAVTSNALAGIANESQDLGGAVSSRGAPHAAWAAAACVTLSLASAARAATGLRRTLSSRRWLRFARRLELGMCFCALSGGVDSSVAAVLVHRAIGDQLTCVFVNNGVLRKNEFAQVTKNLRDKLG
jgi:GMP synthase (glutamine-hydrolysing)